MITHMLIEMQDSPLILQPVAPEGTACNHIMRVYGKGGLLKGYP